MMKLSIFALLGAALTTCDTGVTYTVPVQSVEETQTVQISEIKGSEYATDDSETNDTFEYVALGNSVTCNIPCDYWWGTYGMAASSPDKDYVHQVKDYIANAANVDVNVKTGSVKDWELSTERNSCFQTFDGVLNEETDLVTVQVGENITENKEHLYEDFSNLFLHIGEKAPNAQVIVIGNVLWDFEDVNNVKAQVCADNGIIYVDMSEFKVSYDTMYKSYVGTTVTDDNGNEHEIWYDCVAAHPNDAGMSFIAGKINEQIVFKEKR